MADNIDWYYLNAANHPTGPLKLPGLKQLYTSNTIKADTLVWHDKLAEWASVETVQVGSQSLKSLIAPPPPAPVPPPVPAKPAMAPPPLPAGPLPAAGGRGAPAPPPLPAPGAGAPAPPPLPAAGGRGAPAPPPMPSGGGRGAPAPPMLPPAGGRGAPPALPPAGGVPVRSPAAPAPAKKPLSMQEELAARIQRNAGKPSPAPVERKEVAAPAPKAPAGLSMLEEMKLRQQRKAAAAQAGESSPGSPVERKAPPSPSQAPTVVLRSTAGTSSPANRTAPSTVTPPTLPNRNVPSLPPKSPTALAAAPALPAKSFGNSNTSAAPSVNTNKPGLAPPLPAKPSLSVSAPPKSPTALGPAISNPAFAPRVQHHDDDDEDWSDSPVKTVKKSPVAAAVGKSPLTFNTGPSAVEKQRAEAERLRQEAIENESKAKREEEAKKRRAENAKRAPLKSVYATRSTGATVGSGKSSLDETDEDGQEQSEWEELMSADGIPYYYNRHTNQTTWDKPDDSDSSGQWMWIPDEEEAFLPARVVQTMFDGSMQLDTERGKRITIRKEQTGSLIPLVKSSLKKLVEDLVMLDDMNEALILHNLKERFRRDKIYSRVGTILISVNPFKQLPLYTPDIIDRYHKRGMREVPPHVYEVADSAFVSLNSDSTSQSIIISGESGAGKTEATKQCLQYFAEVAGSTSGVEEKILLANPILEAFGNAKTLRNDNSSRFGKWIEILFDPQGRICGAKTSNYLLEKSRVVFQARGERNYHIFYQLCAGASDEMSAEYGLRPISEWSYLNQSGCIEIKNVSDAEEFGCLSAAMDNLNFSEDERDSIFAIVASVLNLGNIQFLPEGDLGSRIVDDTEVDVVSRLLKVDKTALKSGITSRTMEVRGTTTVIHLDPEAASDCRNGLAKALYGRMFDWLVQRINQSMKTNVTVGKTRLNSPSLIGVLDIFGFEIFQHNSFEQLCINYANEKLQQHFNKNTFKLEEAVYEQEQIIFEHVAFIDNQPVLDLIESRPDGVFCVLDEEIVIPRGSDEGFVKKLHSKHAANKNYQAVMKQPNCFSVKHYAGDVVYDSKSFLDKNKDQMSADLLTVLETSRNRFIQSLFPSSADDASKKKGRKMTLGAQFKGQLDALMATIDATEPHYIRCVKPNAAKMANTFSGPMILEQLRYSGVFEAVTIRQKGFPFRLTHQKFIRRFRCLDPKANLRNDKRSCETLLKRLEEDVSKIQVGLSQVLYRAEQHKRLELRRNLAIEKLILIAQKVYKGLRARKLKKALLAVRPILKKAIESRDLNLLTKAIDQSSGYGFEIFELAKAKKLKHRILEEKRVTDALTDLLKKDIEVVFEQLLAAVESAEAVEFASDLVRTAQQKVEKQRRIRTTRANLKTAAAEFNEELLISSLAVASELGMQNVPEAENAKKVLQRLQQEKELSKKLLAALTVGGAAQVRADVKLVRYNNLEAVLAEANGSKPHQFGPLLEAVKAVELLIDLRKAWYNDDWDKVEGLLIKTGEHPPLVPLHELKVANEELALRAAVEKVTATLQTAIAKRDQGVLSHALEQAVLLQMNQPIVSEADSCLKRIIVIRDALRSALTTLEEEQLGTSVKMAEGFQYETDEVKQARFLRDRVKEINAEANVALNVLEKSQLESVYKQAQEIKLSNVLIQEIKAWLFDTPEEKFLQKQLQAAVLLSDQQLIIERTIRLKDNYFKKSAGLFELRRYPKLREPAEFASAKFFGLFGKEELMTGMLFFTKNPIHTSLMELDPILTKEATKLFKCIMGYMGDRQGLYPLMLAQEILSKGVGYPELRDEIYCQLMKQLTDNPSSESISKGWQLVAFCLETFPPSNTFDNFLEIFLRERSEPAQKYLGLLHARVYGGARSQAPSVGEIQRVLNEGHRGSRRISISAKNSNQYSAKTHPHLAAKRSSVLQIGASGLSVPAGPEAKKTSFNGQEESKGPVRTVSTAPQQQQQQSMPRTVSAAVPQTAPVATVPASVPGAVAARSVEPASRISARVTPIRPVPPPPAAIAHDWQEVKDGEGNVYYWNKQTNETTWDRPECMK
eukprot:GILK01008660.1.p1 GENE.GILK01008660.1~~GILK01008660.1.p1  ORF type:complete len:2044 (+),score=493.00 GILK01008660.1:237-6368(+)